MRFRILLLTVFSLAHLLSGYSQGLEKTIDLGDRYFESGQIAEALYTYQRVVFFSPSGAESEDLLKIAECFVMEGDFEKSIEYFDHAYYAGINDSIKTEILFRKANSFIQTANYHFALIDLLGINTDEGSLLERRKCLYLATAYYGLEDYTNAESHFLKTIPKSESGSVDAIKKIFSKKGNFYRPNPNAALWMSVFLPGSGQFYSGDWAAGLNSFLLTGSLVGLTFYLTKQYHPIDAILTALPWFQRYYQGGFGQAEKIAELRRAKKRDRAYQDILNIISRANLKNQAL